MTRHTTYTTHPSALANSSAMSRVRPPFQPHTSGTRTIAVCVRVMKRKSGNDYEMAFSLSLLWVKTSKVFSQRVLTAFMSGFAGSHVASYWRSGKKHAFLKEQNKIQCALHVRNRNQIFQVCVITARAIVAHSLLRRQLLPRSQTVQLEGTPAHKTTWKPTSQ